MSQFGLSSALQLICPVVFIGSCAIIMLVRGFHIEPAQGDAWSKMNPEFYRYVLYRYVLFVGWLVPVRFCQVSVCRGGGETD